MYTVTRNNHELRKGKEIFEKFSWDEPLLPRVGVLFTGRAIYP